MPNQSFNLGEFQSGLKNAHNPFGLPLTALTDGGNVELYRGLRTRKGYEVVSAGEISPGSVAGSVSIPRGCRYYVTFEGADGSQDFTDYLGHPLSYVENGYGKAYHLDASQHYSGSTSLYTEGGTPAEVWRAIQSTHADIDFSGGEDLVLRAHFRIGSGGGHKINLFSHFYSGSFPGAMYNWYFRYDEDDIDREFKLYLDGDGDGHTVEAACSVSIDTWWRVELQYDAGTGTYTIAADEAANWTGNGTTRGMTDPGKMPLPYTHDQPLCLAETAWTFDNMWLDDMQIVYGSADPVDAEGLPVISGEVCQLVQVRHPTAEKTYLLAQVKDSLTGGNYLAVCDDILPGNNLEFTNLYDLGTGAGVASIATLGDRTIICTDGKEPVVFSGGLASGSAASDWPHPYQVLIRPTGQDAYDVSREVLDKDGDVSFVIGGVASSGDMIIVTEAPYVKGFFFTLAETNNGQGADSGSHVALEATYTSEEDCDIEDVKGQCVYWRQSSTLCGNFEGAQQDLDSAAAVDKSGGLVGIPCTNHGYSSDDTVRIFGTANYNGTYVLDVSTSIHEMVITETYTPETFSGTEGVRLRPTLGSGNTHPRIEPGLRVSISGSDYYLVAITGNGVGDGEVQLSGQQVDSEISGMYGLVVDTSGCVRTMREGSSGASVLLPSLNTHRRYMGGFFSFRLVVPSECIDDGNFSQIRVKFSTPDFLGFCAIGIDDRHVTVKHASVGIRDANTANTIDTPVELTFNNGESGYTLGEASAIWSDWTDFVGDGTDDLVISLDGGDKYLMDSAMVGSTEVFRYGPSITMWIPNEDSDPTTIMFYYVADPVCDCYNVADIESIYSPEEIKAASWKFAGVVDLEVRTPYAAVAGWFVMATSETNEISVVSARSVSEVTVTSQEPGNSAVFHAVCFSGNRDSYWAFKSGAWTEIARSNGGIWSYNHGSWTAAETNDRLQALYQAFLVPDNQMTTGELQEITEEQWESPGGFQAYVTPTLSFASCLVPDDSNVPMVQAYSVTIYDTGTAAIEYWDGNRWTDGSGFSDGTLDGAIPFGRSGAVSYNGSYTEPSIATLEGVQGYFFRLSFVNGLSSRTSLTRVQVQYEPAQLLSNLDDGFPDYPAGVIVDTGATVQDYTAEAIDDTNTDMATVWLCNGDPAESPDAFGADGAVYVGGPSRFNQVMLEPHHVYYNQAESKLSVAYWNGTRYVSLAVDDTTMGSGGETLNKKGVVSWDLPSDWKIHRPIDSPDICRAYWVRITVSNDLTAPTGIYEARIWDVPESLPKYKYAVVANNRLFLASRPDAPSQIDISREREEFGFSGNDSAGIYLGGDSITAVFAAWDNVIICQPSEMRALTFGSPSEWNITKLQVTETPVNSRVVVHAPIGGPQSAGTTKQGLFFLNHRGAWVYSGLQADQAFATGQGVNLSQDLNWWDEEALPRIDKNYLFRACGVYWPEKNWVIWSVPMITSSGQTSQTTNNRLIVHDLNLGAWLPPFTIAVASICVAHHHQEAAPGKLGQLGLYAGDYAGRILRLFSDTTDKDASGEPIAIPAWVETGWTDFGLRSRKFLRTVSMIGETGGDAVTVSFHRDGSSNADTAVVRFEDVAGPVGKEAQFECEPSNRSARYWKWRIAAEGPSTIHQVHLEMEADRDWPRMTR